MNSSEPNPPKSSSSSSASARKPGQGSGPGRGRRSQPSQAADRATSDAKKPDSGPDNGRRRNGGAPSRGAPGGGGRGRKRQPAQGGGAANAAPVVPRILMRPERIAQASEEPVVVARRPVASPTPPQPPQPLGVGRPVVAEALGVADIAAYKAIAEQPRGSRLMLLSPAGRLLDSVVRKHLGTVDCRACIGVLGRPSAGKSLVLSRLAQCAEGDVFPLAAEGRVGTTGVDFWVTPARIILVDTPPVLSLVPADVRVRLMGPGAPELARTRDLQLATLLMQVSDVLLVFADSALDRGLVELLVDARTLSMDLPRLDAPHLPSEPSAAQRHKCKLHIVLGAGCHGGDLDAVARAYEAATGITVCGVSLLPRAMPVARGSGPPRFMRVAESWADAPVCPLYPPLDVGAKSSGSVPSRSLLGWPVADGSGGGSFELAVEALRARLLAPAAAGGWEERRAGVWMSTCLRAWDSIRRSFQLQNMAAAFELPREGRQALLMKRK
ncbi:hypothetical protein H4S07_001148 [Coemansia furcata]|uniref:Uncharacterized protein n=1 Tax=Coemansia furcata TaxID=417177 RepID=A0ACC1LQ84_9FUNG|nr:hypothetical protein H4S07_001148 [Coemansia furcata]